jgi:glycine betaine catabolism A
VSVPLDPEAVAAAAAPFGESLTLPGEAYTSPDVFRWERRHLFAGGWVCAGRVDELRAGDVTQRALDVGDVGVLLTFDDGGVRAFANVCRHRGHELLPIGESSERPALVCPYHGWAYRLDGALTTATGMREVPGFDFEAYGLVALPVAEWQGWLLVNAAGGAPPVADHVGGLDALLRPYRCAELRLQARHDYEVAANWKVIAENYQECYHCPLIHPELCKVSPPASGDNWDLPGVWVGGSMDLREHAVTMSFDGAGSGVFIDGAPRGVVRYVALFPNLLISAHPDYVMTHRLTPLAADRTAVECSWLFPAEATGDPAYAVEFWDLTNRQDWAACESVQRGVSSPHFRPGPLGPREDAVHQWISLVAHAYQLP